MEGQAAEELWHLTIDDLLTPPAENPRLGGPGPFVINLSTSTTPVTVPAEGLAQFPQLHAYQVKGNEDGRTRYRLRLGPISSELEADAILAAVRERYPSAFTATAGEDDLRIIRRKSPRAAEAQPQAPSLAELVADDLKVAPPAAPEQHGTPDLPVSAAMRSLAHPQVASEPNPVEAEPGEFTIDFDAFLPPTTTRAIQASVDVAAPPVAFEEPELDTDAVTDQVAVLTLPAADEVVGAWLDDAAAMIVAIPQRPPQPAADAARKMEPAAGSALADAHGPEHAPQAEHELDLDLELELELRAAPLAAYAAESAGPQAAILDIDDSMSLEGIVAKNNAMVDSLEARNEGPVSEAPAVEEPVLTTVVELDEQVPVLVEVVTSMAEVLPPLLIDAGDDLLVPVLVESPGVLETPDVFESPEVLEPPYALEPPVEAQLTAGAVAQASRPIEILAEPLPAMDCTQTIRELTPLELADDEASQWFAIQLSLTEDAIDAEKVPHLDIFDAYRLYSVAGLEQGSFMHVLRLGFFTDEGSAQAVAGYLRAFFEAPVVKRVSLAERDRFAERRVVPRRDVGATGTHTIIELSTAPRVPERRLADISGRPERRSSDSGSLWSRLVAPLKR